MLETHMQERQDGEGKDSRQTTEYVLLKGEKATNLPKSKHRLRLNGYNEGAPSEAH